MFYIDSTTAKLIKKYPERASDIVQSFNYKQVLCKDWLVSKLYEYQLTSFENIHIVGCWYGQIIVPRLRGISGEIILYDIDRLTIKLARRYLEYFDRVSFKVGDATEKSFKNPNDLVINTSAEHMPPLKIKRGTFAIQSNDYTSISDHTNCVISADELRSNYNFKPHHILYSGEKQFDNYTRFMIVGERGLE